MVDLKKQTVKKKKKSQKKNISSELNSIQKDFLKKVIETAPKFITENDNLGEFISLYFLCEALLRKICEYSADSRNKKIRSTNINVRNTYNLTKYYFSNLDKFIFDKIFMSVDTRNNKSCKSLRNGIVHNLLENDCKEVNARFEDLKAPMLYWIDIIKEKIGFTETEK